VATLGNHVEVVSLLLEHKPNVNALDKDGCTALAIACREGHHEIANALLNAGAYVNIQDRVGDTNLIHAVKGGHRGVVESLLKKYADVDIAGKVRIYNLFFFYICVSSSKIDLEKIIVFTVHCGSQLLIISVSQIVSRVPYGEICETC